MYRPFPLAHPFLILALGALILPLSAQQQLGAPAAPAAEAPLAQQADQPLPRLDMRQLQGQLQDQTQAVPQPAPRRDPREARRQQVEMRMRAMMSDFGIDNTAKQDAIIAYLAEDEVGKATVREAGRRLLVALRRGVQTARTRDLIAVYKAALDADKERRAAAQTALDAKIGFSLDPRL